MGLSIHYRGYLRNKESLPALVEEVADIVKVYQWPYHILDTEFPMDSGRAEKLSNDLYGICFTPTECETVSICFLSNGQLTSVLSWHLFDKKLMSEREILDSWVSVKTQFAGDSIHKIIIHLLEYVSKKYLSDFELNDEGLYWETRDEKLLQEKFAFLSGIINNFRTALDEHPRNQGENFEKYFERILQQIQSKNKLSE
jgi:hypothetical protein